MTLLWCVLGVLLGGIVGAGLACLLAWLLFFRHYRQSTCAPGLPAEFYRGLFLLALGIVAGGVVGGIVGWHSAP
jgi:hypothetical protein